MEMPSKTTLNDINAYVENLGAKTKHTDEAVRNIRQAILEKGVAVTKETTLSELPEKIGDIYVFQTTESSPVGEIIAFLEENF